jgi:hypothetical protein
MPEKPGEKQGTEQDRLAYRGEDESPEVEGHRLNYDPAERAARGEDQDAEEEGGEGRLA